MSSKLLHLQKLHDYTHTSKIKKDLIVKCFVFLICEFFTTLRSKRLKVTVFGLVPSAFICANISLQDAKSKCSLKKSILSHYKLEQNATAESSYWLDEVGAAASYAQYHLVWKMNEN